MIYFTVYFLLLGLAVVYNHAQIQLMGYPLKGVDAKSYSRYQNTWHLCQGAAMAVVVAFLEYNRCGFFNAGSSISILITGSVLFDMSLNKLRGNPFFYVGKTAPTDQLIRWIAARLKKNVELTGLGVRIILLSVSLSASIWS